jgi:hypothetical protein
MSVLTNLLAAAAIAGGVAGAVTLASRWSSETPHRAGETPRRSAGREADEEPLQTGFVKSGHIGMVVGSGYPWNDLRPAFPKLKRDLPPEPGPESSKDREDRLSGVLSELRFGLPSGRVPWPKLVAALKARIEPHGVPVSADVKDVPDTYVVELPAREWAGHEVFGHIHNSTTRWIVYTVTCDGIAIGTDAWVNRARRDARLGENNRRVAAEQRAAPLDVPFRPDVVDADLVAFVRTMQAQTDVEVVVDPAIWEMVPSVIWRGPPRPLRDALDELCSRFRWYWRWHDGRVWLLKP